MATTTRVLTASVNGTVYTTNANGALEAIDTCHSGATAPTDEVANGKFWLDTTTTPGILKMYDNATWNVVVNATNVTAAGALMDSELTAIASVKALDQGVATTDSPTFVDVTATSLVVNGNNYPSAGPLSHRNVIINGGMQVAQRPNRSPAGFSGSFYAGPDRWLVNRAGTGATGFSQVSSTSYGGTKAAQATFLAAAGEAYVVTHRIEAANIAHLAGQQVTLSFWASGSSDAGSATLNATLSYASAPDNFTTETTISSSSVSYSGSAAYYTFTFTLPSGAANGVGVKFEGAQTDATGTFTLTFGGVQLELGDTATPFEHRSYGDELARCQRYYYQTSHDGTTQTNYISLLNEASANTAAGGTPHPVEMRAAPSIYLGSGIRYYSPATGTIATTIITNRSGKSYFALVVSATGITVGLGGTLFASTTDGYLAADAEL